MSHNKNENTTEQYTVTVVSAAELCAPSGIFDEELGRELANEEVARMMGYLITTEPKYLSDDDNRINKTLRPGDPYRTTDANEVLHAIVGERPKQDRNTKDIREQAAAERVNRQRPHRSRTARIHR